MRLTPTIALAGVATLVLAGCSGTAAGSTPDDGLVRIVASTNVYGNIAEQVGGDLVSVTSIISNQAQDPHSYEASARDQLALSNAQLVIENGGGYDPFIDTLLGGSNNPDVVIVNASDVSGLIDGDTTDDHAGETAEEHAAHVDGFNEHVWYSFDAMDHVAEEIAHELGLLDAANAAAYETNYETFAAGLAALETRADTIGTLADGRSAAITEPVPLYLLQEAGLDNMTPEAFSASIEEGTDVPPAVLQQTLALFGDGSIALLAYNEQTAGAETEQVRAAAEAAGVNVVSFSETMPEGDDYLGWMNANLDAIETALG